MSSSTIAQPGKHRFGAHESSASATAVDVVVPCYNYGRYLTACVESVLSQNGVHVRVLVIDDASEDDSAEVAQVLAAKDARVEFYRHRSNRGHIATYNEGLLDWATAPYQVLLSADDMLAPGSLGRAVEVMSANPNVGLVYGPVVRFVDTPPPIPASTRFRYTVFEGAQWLQIRCRSGHNVITSPEVVVRTSIQKRVGGYRPELPHAGDLEMWLRIAAVSDFAFIRRVPQAFYRIHPSNMTKARNALVDMQERKNAFDSFCQTQSHGPASEACRSSANRSIAREALWRACRAYDKDQLAASRSAELIDFAMNIYPEWQSLPEYRALRRRQRLGPSICHKTQLFAPSAFVRKIDRWRKQQRWRRRGI